MFFLTFLSLCFSVSLTRNYYKIVTQILMTAKAYFPEYVHSNKNFYTLYNLVCIKNIIFLKYFNSSSPHLQVDLSFLCVEVTA